MIRLSNTVVGALNILSLLIGLAAVGTSLHIHVHKGAATDCQKVLEYPLLIGGIFVVLVSTLAITGSMWRVNVALYMYLFVTFLLIVSLVFFTIFALIVTNKKVERNIYGKGSEGYRVNDFSHWLQRYVVNDKNWDEVKSCLMDAHVCQNLALKGGHHNNDSLIFQHLSTTQNGCCKPPVSCGYTMKNATYWEVPKTGPTVNNSDCTIWNNKQNKLCYDCNSCKGGVLANIRNQWKLLTVFNACVLVLVATIYVLGCYAIRNNRLESLSNQPRAPNP